MVLITCKVYGKKKIASYLILIVHIMKILGLNAYYFSVRKVVNFSKKNKTWYHHLISIVILWHRYFPVNFKKLLQTPFLQNTFGRLLLLISCRLLPRIYTSSFMSIISIKFCISNSCIGGGKLHLYLIFDHCFNRLIHRNNELTILFLPFIYLSYVLLRSCLHQWYIFSVSFSCQIEWKYQMKINLGDKVAVVFSMITTKTSLSLLKSYFVNHSGLIIELSIT